MTTAITPGGIMFTDADVVNPDEFVPAPQQTVRPFLLHDHGFVLAVVFADCLQDALDIAADAGKMDLYKVDEEDYGDYDWDTGSPPCSFLGNASEPFDIESLGVEELTNPPFSFVALYDAT